MASNCFKVGAICDQAICVKFGECQEFRVALEYFVGKALSGSIEKFLLKRLYRDGYQEGSML